MENKMQASSSSSSSAAAAAAAAARRRRRTSKHRCPPGPRPFPWLVIPHGKLGKDQVFYNQSKKTYYWKSIPELSSKSLSYFQKPSHKEWLIILCVETNDDDDDDKANDDKEYVNSKWKQGDCILWNPVSFQTIKLPSLGYWFNISIPTTYYVNDCVLSSPPPTKPDNNNDDSMVFFLFSGRDNTTHYLVYCRPGDKKWRKRQLLNEGNKYDGPDALCFIDGKLHIPFANATHMVLDKKKLELDGTLSERTSFNFCDKILSPIADFYNKYAFRSNYVESCEEELFKVLILYNAMTGQKEFIDLQVFKMDFSLMDWAEVKSLGDHVLFLGQRTRMSCSAAELGLTRGRVYYTLENDATLYAYNLEDGSVSFSLPYPKRSTASSFWMNWIQIPRTKKRGAADGGRRPLDILGSNVEEDITIDTENKKTDDDENEEGMNNNGELEEKGPWGTFNQDIMELLAKYLHPVDYMHYHAVCRATRSATPIVSWSWRTPSTETTQTTTFLSPWLIFHGKQGDIYNFVDPMHNNDKYFMNLSEFLLDATIRFSKGGWLLMSRGEKTLFFFNPFTKAIIHLPDLDLLDEHVIAFYGISFSSLPTSPDCVVFSINAYKDVVSIYFISHGANSWRYYIFNNSEESEESEEICMKFIPWRNNPVFHKGVFYCLDHRGTLGVFDYGNDFHWKVLEKPRSPCNDISQCFLVECDGKLLAVFIGHLRKRVRIFSMDFSKMVWVKVNSLGKHMLFISNTSSLSSIAPCPQMENKIYFPRFYGEGIVYYSLDTGRYHSHSIGSEHSHSSQDFYDTKEQLYCSWIEPNWSHTTVQELDWLSVL